MKNDHASVRQLAPVMLVTCAAFVLLAGITAIYGTEFGLNRETANILSLVFLFVAVADAFASVFLKHHSGTLSANKDRKSVSLFRQLRSPESDRQDLDRV